MAETKTKQTEASVTSYLAAIDDDGRWADCEALAKLMTKATKEPARMWGSGIVGFGAYHYRYASGHEGDACLTGFSLRKSDISVYLAAEFAGREELLGRLGRHKIGRACLQIKRLADVDASVLEELVRRTAAEHRRQHTAT